MSIKKWSPIKGCHLEHLYNYVILLLELICQIGMNQKNFPTPFSLNFCTPKALINVYTCDCNPNVRRPHYISNTYSEDPLHLKWIESFFLSALKLFSQTPRDLSNHWSFILNDQYTTSTPPQSSWAFIVGTRECYIVWSYSFSVCISSLFLFTIWHVIFHPLWILMLSSLLNKLTAQPKNIVKVISIAFKFRWTIGRRFNLTLRTACLLGRQLSNVYWMVFYVLNSLRNRFTISDLGN